MKCGRMTGSEVNEFGEALATIMKKNPGKSVAVAIAPFLVSERVSGYRAQLRTIVKSLKS